MTQSTRGIGVVLLLLPAGLLPADGPRPKTVDDLMKVRTVGEARIARARCS